MDSRIIDQEVASLLKNLTPTLEELGGRVKGIVQVFLREHLDVFSEEWIKISSQNSSPGVSGGLHVDLELHVPSRTLWRILRRYAELEDFDRENIFSSDPPRVMSYAQPQEVGRRELPIIFWVEHRETILRALLTLEEAAREKVS